MTTDTYYRLAMAPSEYAACRALQKCDPQFPTILAYRGGELIAFLSTLKHPRDAIAGPLVVKVTGNKGFIVRRLVDAYENVLKSFAVSSYYFAVNHGKKKWLNQIEELGIAKAVKETKTQTLFKREL